MKYKIYKLIYQNEVVYVGQTTRDLKVRKLDGYRYNPELHKIIKECDIQLIEETEDKTRESHWIEYYINIGCKLYNRYKGEIGLDIKEYKKRWQQQNKETVNERKKKWRKENKEKIKQYLEKEKEYRKKWRESNKEHIKEYQKQWRESNKERIEEYQKQYWKEYYQKKKLEKN